MSRLVCSLIHGVSELIVLFAMVVTKCALIVGNVIHHDCVANHGGETNHSC